MTKRTCGETQRRPIQMPRIAVATHTFAASVLSDPSTQAPGCLLHSKRSDNPSFVWFDVARQGAVTLAPVLRSETDCQRGSSNTYDTYTPSILNGAVISPSLPKSMHSTCLLVLHWGGGKSTHVVLSGFNTLVNNGHSDVSGPPTRPPKHSRWRRIVDI